MQSSLRILKNLNDAFLQIVFSDQKLLNSNSLDRFLNDDYLQQELLGKINTQDFLVYEEYISARNMLFELLSSGKSHIEQIIDRNLNTIQLVTS